MRSKLEPTTNHYGRDVTRHVPPPGDVPVVVGMRPPDRDVWALAAPYLRVRDNDAHTLYSYAIARALLDIVPGADPEVVLPAILLHDVGWSRVPADEVLEAIAPGAGRPDLVVLHEKAGAAIARDVLGVLGHHTGVVDAVVAIVDGHDTRREAISLDDAVVKDADKLWRLTPHGLDTVMEWFGLTRDEAHRLVASRVHLHLLTDEARTMARILGAVASTDTSQELALLCRADAGGPIPPA